MRAYLDASVLVAMLTHDPFNERAEELLRRKMPIPIVSDFAAAEFASALGRRVRAGELQIDHARTALSNLDALVARSAERVETTGADVAIAAAFLRRLDLTLRTPDALHIAIAQRVDADLATFDVRMADAARMLGSGIVDA